MFVFCVFFFKQKTAYEMRISDWSSDVCSSDLLDTPPVLPVDDSRVISAQADGVVLLVRWRRTPAKAAELALRQLDEVGARVLGASLTQVDMIAQTRDRQSTRLNSSHSCASRKPSSAWKKK